MTAVVSKVCVVGDFAVGKTSVTERFVNNHFSEAYLSTVGVKIDTTQIDFPDLDVQQKLVIWDVAGADTFGPTEFAYLRGADGFIYVADEIGCRFPDVLARLKSGEPVPGAISPGPDESVIAVQQHAKRPRARQELFLQIRCNRARQVHHAPCNFLSMIIWARQRSAVPTSSPVLALVR